MNATYTNIVKAFNALLTAGGTFASQMEKIADGHTPHPELIEALARAVAKQYKCHTAISQKGAWNFYKSEESKERHDSALSCWKRNVTPWIKSESKPKPAVRKQVDKIEAMATRLQKQLSKRELNRLMALLSA
jgi:hypothetical protein